MPEITNTRFGAVSFEEQDIITFPDGVIGFPQCTRFVVVSRSEQSPFRWLQSIDLPEFAFLVTDPACYVSNYEPVMGESLSAQLEIGEKTPTLLYTTVSIPHGSPHNMTLNLAGPIVINVETRIGRQFIVEDEAYTVKHRAFPTESASERAAA